MAERQKPVLPIAPALNVTAPPMKEHGFVEGLKTEWNLFWETILGDDGMPETETHPESKDPFVNGKLEVLSLDQIKVVTKALSSDRKKLNQRMESLLKEIDENTTRLESLKLVGGDIEDTELKLNELSDMGQNISEQLHRINERLKLARGQEDCIKKNARDL